MGKYESMLKRRSSLRNMMHTFCEHARIFKPRLQISDIVVPLIARSHSRQEPLSIQITALPLIYISVTIATTPERRKKKSPNHQRRRPHRRRSRRRHRRLQRSGKEAWDDAVNSGYAVISYLTSTCPCSNIGQRKNGNKMTIIRIYLVEKDRKSRHIR